MYDNIPFVGAGPKAISVRTSLLLLLGSGSGGELGDFNTNMFTALKLHISYPHCTSYSSFLQSVSRRRLYDLRLPIRRHSSLPVLSHYGSTPPPPESEPSISGTNFSWYRAEVGKKRVIYRSSSIEIHLPTSEGFFQETRTISYNPWCLLMCLRIMIYYFSF